MGAPQFENYDPADVVVELMGQPIKGFAPGTFIKVGRMTDTFTDTAGALGDVIRTRSRDARGTVEVTLMDGHPSNQLLQAAASDDENTGSGVGPALIKHKSGYEFASGKHSWVTKKPDSEYKSGESGTRVWVIRIANMDYKPNGYAVPVPTE